MRFTKIDLANVRIIEQASLEPSAGINLLYGKNGSGKTSVLEALHILSRGKSFRTSKIDELVKRGQTGMRIFTEMEKKENRTNTVSFCREKGKTKSKFNQKPIKTQSELSVKTPIFVQTTDSHSLVFGGPKQRRKWLDWMLFHVEPSYLDEWKQFHKALRHRNSLLRRKRSDRELISWEQQMAGFAVSMYQQCQDVLTEMQKGLADYSAELLTEIASTRYQAGWDVEKGYLNQLEAQRAADIEQGKTRSGPHRSDIDLLFGQQRASKILSRGQAKLYLSTLLLAQTNYIQQHQDDVPVLLVDDVAAELDQDSRTRLLKALKNIGAQVFITTTEPELFECEEMALFHVKQGQINMVKS